MALKSSGTISHRLVFRNYSSYELFKEVLMNKYVPDNTQIIMISELEELTFLSSEVPDKVLTWAGVCHFIGIPT